MRPLPDRDSRGECHCDQLSRTLHPKVGPLPPPIWHERCTPIPELPSADMHRCLRVVDIFYYILEFVILELWDDEDPWKGYNDYWVGNPTLAALARTCRGFHDPALNVLWRNQLTLGPLIKTLPPDAIKEVIEDGLPEYLFHHLVSGQ